MGSATLWKTTVNVFTNDSILFLPTCYKGRPDGGEALIFDSDMKWSRATRKSSFSHFDGNNWGHKVAKLKILLVCLSSSVFLPALQDFPPLPISSSTSRINIVTQRSLELSAEYKYTTLFMWKEKGLSLCPIPEQTGSLFVFWWRGRGQNWNIRAKAKFELNWSSSEVTAQSKSIIVYRLRKHEVQRSKY